MTDTIIRLIFNAVTVLGSFAIATFGAIQIYNTFSDRKLKEVTAKAKESSVGETALAELLKGQQTIREDLKEIDEEIEKMKDDMYNEKKELQERLEKLRNHFDEMTKDYFKILSGK